MGGKQQERRRTWQDGTEPTGTDRFIVRAHAARRPHEQPGFPGTDRPLPRGLP